MKDEILETIYAAKRKVAEECDYDFKKLVERCKREQAEHPESLVDHVPKSDPEPLPT
jgi:hypothetical protein